MTPKSVTKKSGSRHPGRQTATGQTRSVRGVRRLRGVPGRAAGWPKAQPQQENSVKLTKPRPPPAAVQATGLPVAARRTMRTGGNRARPRRRLPDHCHRAGPGASTRRPNTPARSTAAKPAARRPRRRDRAPATAAWRGRIGGKALQRTSTKFTRHDRMHENSASMLGSSISRRISGRIHRTHRWTHRCKHQRGHRVSARTGRDPATQPGMIRPSAVNAPPLSDAPDERLPRGRHGLDLTRRRAHPRRL